MSECVKRFDQINRQMGKIAFQVAGFRPPVGQFHEPTPKISERQVLPAGFSFATKAS
jgi:hypothetical protein